MVGYIIVLILLFTSYLLFPCNSKKSTKNFLITITLVMIIFYGFRASHVGSDTLAYREMFIKDGSQTINQLAQNMWKQKSPLYVLSEWVFYKILPFPQLWLFATSAFFFIIFAKFLYENSETPLYSYLMFFTLFGTFQMTGVRQSCAMAIFLISYKFIKEKKIFKYLICMGIAYLFHKTSIIFIPIYWLKNRKIKKMDIIFIIIAIVTIYINRLTIFEYIKGFTSYYYFEALQHTEPINYSIMIYTFTFISYILYFVLEKKLKKEKRQKNDNDNIIQTIENDLPYYSLYTNSMYLASCFMPLVAVNGSIRRIVMCYALFIIFFVPKAINTIFVKPKNRIIVKGALSILLIYFFLSGISGSSYEYSIFL